MSMTNNKKTELEAQKV